LLFYAIRFQGGGVYKINNNPSRNLANPHPGEGHPTTALIQRLFLWTLKVVIVFFFNGAKSVTRYPSFLDV